MQKKNKYKWISVQTHSLILEAILLNLTEISLPVSSPAASSSSERPVMWPTNSREMNSGDCWNSRERICVCVCVCMCVHACVCVHALCVYTLVMATEFREKQKHKRCYGHDHWIHCCILTIGIANLNKITVSWTIHECLNRSHDLDSQWFAGWGASHDPMKQHRIRMWLVVLN